MTDERIQQVLEGDSEAFRFIIREYRDQVYALAMSVVKDEFLAKEVVQEAFISAYTKLEAFRGDAKFSSWLYRIAINQAFKIKKTTKPNSVDIDEVPAGDISPEINRALLKMEEDRQCYYINKGLDELSAKYSLALRLYYLEEMHIKEITEITGWTSSNTKVILHRARKKMKALLTKLFKVNKNDLY